MVSLVVHVALAVCLFWLVNLIGNHSRPFGYQTLSLFERVEAAPAFNALYRVLTPQVFIVLCAAGMSLLGVFRFTHGLWRVTVLYFLFRWAYNVLMGRGVLLNWPNQAVLAVCATLISYWLSVSVLVEPTRGLPDPSDLTTELWLVVILFIYHTLNRVRTSGTSQARRQDRYLEARYRSFRKKYQPMVAEVTVDPWVEALLYSVLIYEDFNRPRIVRLVESRILFPLGIAKTLGPMQVTTDRAISDAEGVRRGARQIMNLYDQEMINWKVPQGKEDIKGGATPTWWERSLIARKVAVGYNPDGSYGDEVVSVYDRILDRFYPSMTKDAR